MYAPGRGAVTLAESVSATAAKQDQNPNPASTARVIAAASASAGIAAAAAESVAAAAAKQMCIRDSHSTGGGSIFKSGGRRAAGPFYLH